MKIKILNLSLQNFKGVRSLTVNFGGVTNITGDNGTGKTSIADAFNWLLFGKNSEDAKDFNIKTLDKNNEPIHRLEHSVSATLDVDGREMTFRRVYQEKWTKKKGEEAKEFTGHETEYYCDDMPLSQKEYQARVDFVMNESIAKMITSPVYFNSLNWTKRREILEAMAGTISNEEIAGTNMAFRNLLTLIGSEKLVNFKKLLAAKKGKIKETLDFIPTRIAEAEHNKPQPENYTAIEKEVKALGAQVSSIDKQMEDKALSYKEQYAAILEKQNEKLKLERKLTEVRSNAGNSKATELQEIETQLRSFASSIKNDEFEIKSNMQAVEKNTLRITSLNNENTKLRSDWETENKRTLVFNEHEFNCPTCQQKLPEGTLEEKKKTITANFNSDKAAKLKSINERGAGNKLEIERLTKSNEVFNNDTEGIKLKIAQGQKQLNELYEKKQTVADAPVPEPAEVKPLQQQINAIVIPESPKVDNEELKAKKSELTTKADALKLRLATREQIAKINERILQLTEDESKLAQELAELERTEFTMAEFSKARIETIEERINGKFSLVKFKMFEQQINGGETECCECMIDGVPFADLNTAKQINAGLDIINALTEHYGTSAPVFIDNRESVIEILPCKSQIINLRAVKDMPLMVDGNPTEGQTEKGAELLSNYPLAA